MRIQQSATTEIFEVRNNFSLTAVAMRKRQTATTDTFEAADHSTVIQRL